MNGTRLKEIDIFVKHEESERLSLSSLLDFALLVGAGRTGQGARLPLR